MASSDQLNQFIKLQIDRLRGVVDLHDLAGRYGLERPGGKGNYRADAGDTSPSLSIYTRNGRQAFRDFRMGDGEDGAGGDFLDFDRRYGPGGAAESLWEQVKRLSQDHGLAFDPPRDNTPRPEKTKEEWLADQCLQQPALSIPYLVGRGIPEDVVKRGIARKTIGYSDWHSDSRKPRDMGYGGPAVAFLCRDLLTNQVLAVDKRFIDPDLNGGAEVEGGIKTQSFGLKDGLGWCIDRAALAAAHTVVVVESAINALAVEAMNRHRWAGYAIRGTGNAGNMDWRWCVGKRVIIAMDADKPGPDGTRPGDKAAWAVYEALAALDIAAMVVDHGAWYANGFNDLADIIKAESPQGVRERLDTLQQWAIPGLPGQNAPDGKSRIFLPAHDFAIYWRFRVKPDFTSYVAKVETDADTGEETLKIEDVAGFRVASLSRVSIASATSTMSGEADVMPHVLFSASVQVPRHGPRLVRRVLDDDRLHNVDQWAKLGPIFNKPKFSRLLTVLERTADLGAREAVNFVGLAWRDGKPIVNEGPDCYFTEPEKQCPYHALLFPSGRISDAATVLRAYQETFRDNAAAMALVWGLGGHLKAFLGFWPHMVMQANKGSGKSTLIKRLERTLGFTMLSGQSLQTEFRLVTSCSYTSHPIGWEELSARRQDIIDKAVGLLQESYQHTVTKRGAEMTEFLLCAPVLLAGEDVPVRSLTGKIVRTNLTRRMGPKLPESLPRFPVREWLGWLATLTRTQVMDAHATATAWLWMGCRAPREDNGAQRMVSNYAAVLTAWQLLCEFAGIERGTGEFPHALRTEMNGHIKETASDREPYVWILETLASEIDAREYHLPHKFEDIDGKPYLILQPGHVMDHFAKSPRLREQFNALPVKSARVFRAQLADSPLVLKGDDDRPAELDKVIDGRRLAHAWALDVEAMAEFGIHIALPEPAEGRDRHYMGLSALNGSRG